MLNKQVSQNDKKSKSKNIGVRWEFNKKKLIEQIEFETKLVNFYHIKKY